MSRLSFKKARGKFVYFETSGATGYGSVGELRGVERRRARLLLGYKSNGVTSICGLQHIWQDASGWHYENTDRPGDDSLNCYLDANTGLMHVASGDIPQEGHVHDSWKDASGTWQERGGESIVCVHPLS